MKSVTTSDAVTVERSADRGLTWRRLVFIAGMAATVAIGAVSAVLGDLEGGAVTLGFALATGLTRVRRGTLGAIGVALGGATTLYFMLTAAMTNIREGSPMSSVLISSVLAAVSRSPSSPEWGSWPSGLPDRPPGRGSLWAPLF